MHRGWLFAPGFTVALPHLAGMLHSQRCPATAHTSNAAAAAAAGVEATLVEVRRLMPA
jgi:hypothetical protein